jgi:RNA polymerase sigma factor (sigma-70 family)
MATDAPDAADFRRLFNDAYRPLLAYALRRGASHADADEVVAETLLVAWRRRAELPSGPDVLPWLYAVARRVLANRRRAAARAQRFRRALRIGSSPPGGTEPEPSLERGEQVRAVLGAVRRLPEPDQEVLRLAVWEGLAHRQIALSLGCSENAVALRLHRARQRLREELVKEGGFPGQELVEVNR